MIDLNLSINSIEKLMKLMKKYHIKELSADFLHLIRDDISPIKKTYKSRNKSKNVLKSINERVEILTDEPWNEITQDQLDHFELTGRNK